MLKNIVFVFKTLIYNSTKNNYSFMNKKKKKISVTINRDLLDKVEQLTTNKSRLIEQALLEYATKNGLKIDDIVL